MKIAMEYSLLLYTVDPANAVKYGPKLFDRNSGLTALVIGQHMSLDLQDGTVTSI